MNLHDLHDFDFIADEEEEEESTIESGEEEGGSQPDGGEGTTEPTPDPTTEPEGTAPEGEGDATATEPDPAATPETITIDGKEYPASDVAEALANYSNATKWQADLTQRAQELSEREKLINSVEEQRAAQETPQEEDPFAGLSPEEKEAITALEERFGFVRKDVVEELRSEVDTLKNERIIAEIQAETQAVQKQYGLSNEEAKELMNYAAQEKMLGWNMEDVYLFKNRGKLKESEQEAVRVKNANARRERGGKTESAAAPKAPKASFKYDSTKHKGIPMSKLLDMAQSFNKE